MVSLNNDRTTTVNDYCLFLPINADVHESALGLLRSYSDSVPWTINN